MLPLINERVGLVGSWHCFLSHSVCIWKALGRCSWNEKCMTSCMHMGARHVGATVPQTNSFLPPRPFWRGPGNPFSSSGIPRINPSPLVCLASCFEWKHFGHFRDSRFWDSGRKRSCKSGGYDKVSHVASDCVMWPELKSGLGFPSRRGVPTSVDYIFFFFLGCTWGIWKFWWENSDLDCKHKMETPKMGLIIFLVDPSQGALSVKAIKGIANLWKIAVKISKNLLSGIQLNIIKLGFWSLEFSLGWLVSKEKQGFYKRKDFKA